MCLANAWEVLHQGSIHREWQNCFIDNNPYFWPLKSRLWVTLLCRFSNTIRPLPTISCHNLSTKSPCVCELENILDVLCLLEFSCSQNIYSLGSHDPTLSLLSVWDYSMLLKLKIGKQLLQTHSDEIRYHSSIANIFSGLTPKSSTKATLYLYLLTFSTWPYILYTESVILPKNKETSLRNLKFFNISTSGTTNCGLKNHNLKKKKPQRTSSKSSFCVTYITIIWKRSPESGKKNKYQILVVRFTLCFKSALRPHEAQEHILLLLGSACAGKRQTHRLANSSVCTSKLFLEYHHQLHLWDSTSSQSIPSPIVPVNIHETGK